jgi:predicted metalloprotease
VLVALAGSTVAGRAAADDPPAAKTTSTGSSNSSTGSHNLVLGSGTQQPETMEEFLTGVTEDVDRYWTKQFADAGLNEPRVSYAWIPEGMTAADVCGTESPADQVAAYCPNDDTIYISQQFANNIYNGSLDGSLPGSSQGYGSAHGDFAVAYIVAHEYAHEVQDELGLFDRQDVPTMDFELQADCYAGTWARSVSDDGRLEDGDEQEALDAALAVGDFDESDPSHHGTPDQRETAWRDGFDAGDPGACSSYVS